MTEPQKAAKGNWDEDYKEVDSEKKESSGDNKEFRKAKYMNMSKPGKYIVRLVGDHVNFRKHFKPYIAKVQDNEKDIDPAWQAGWYPGKKSAVNVINKTEVWDFDNKCATGVGSLEILEKGPSVFKHFANYKSVFDVIPSGKKGPDFMIEVRIPKDDNGEYIRLKTEYLVTHLKESPFTEEEKAMVKAEGGLFPLRDIYKSTPAEKMQEMWDALTEEQKKAPKRDWDDKDKSDSPKAEAKAPEKMEEKMEDSPADAGDDLFDGNDSKSDSDKSEDDSTELF